MPLGKTVSHRRSVYVQLNLRWTKALQWLQLTKSKPEASREAFETRPEGMNHL